MTNRTFGRVAFCHQLQEAVHKNGVQDARELILQRQGHKRWYYLLAFRWAQEEETFAMGKK